MSRVLTPILLRYIDGDHWELSADYRCVSDLVGPLMLPAGTVTDFNSVPQVLWNIFPPTEYAEAALPHDLLYKDGTVNGQPIDRVVADKVHREFLIWRKAPAWKVRTMYAGLRLGGWVAWRRYRNAEKSGPAPA